MARQAAWAVECVGEESFSGLGVYREEHQYRIIGEFVFRQTTVFARPFGLTP